MYEREAFRVRRRISGCVIRLHDFSLFKRRARNFAPLSHKIGRIFIYARATLDATYTIHSDLGPEMGQPRNKIKVLSFDILGAVCTMI